MNKDYLGKIGHLSFPVGAHLCRKPMPPMEELKQDMESLKRNGFNFVKLQEHWMLDEPEEGKIELDVYEELISYARKLDLFVYFGFTFEQAPHWIYEKFPDCRLVGKDGRTIFHEATTTMPADGKPGPCFDHEGVVNAVKKFIEKAMEILAKYENIFVWNVWQEIGMWGERLVGTQVCYCKNTIRAWQDWLKTKYQDIDCLNREWRTNYKKWSDIYPDRLLEAMPSAQEINWRFFLNNIRLQKIISERVNTIKSFDPLKRPVFAHKSRPEYGGTEDWTYAKSLDFLGSSCYPAWGFGSTWDDDYQRPFEREYALLNETWDNIIYQFDFIRSANFGKGHFDKPVWAAEFQGGPISSGFHKGRVPSDEDIRRWLLAAVTAGVTAVSFWVARAEIMASEQNGFSLLDSVGDSSDRIDEVSRIIWKLSQEYALFAQPTLQNAEVALLLDEHNYLLCNLFNQGGENLQYSIRGWHRLLWELNIPIDFLSSEEDCFENYKIIIYPFPIVITRGLQKKLLRYVENGGTVVFEAAAGRIDENGFCQRGEISPLLLDICKIKQKNFIMVREPDKQRRWSPEERTWGEFIETQTLKGNGILAGENLLANVYLQTFEIDSNKAEPILLTTNNEICGIRKQHEKGNFIVLGTFVGHNGTAYRSESVKSAISKLLNFAKIAPEYRGKFLLRKRKTKNKEAWIFFNPCGTPVTEKIFIEHKSYDLFSGNHFKAGSSIEVKIEALDFKVLIVEK